MFAVIKKQIRVQWENWMVCLIIILGGGIAGEVLFRVIRAFVAEEAKEFIPVGTVMAAALAIIFLGIIGIMSLEMYFNLEISMGCTRGRFFVSYYLNCLTVNLMGAGLVVLTAMAENQIGLWLYPDLEKSVNLLPYLLRWSVPAAIFLSVFSVLWGALGMRFGKKIYWLLWGLWMLLSIGGPRIVEAVEEAPDSIFGRFGALLAAIVKVVPGSAWLTGCIVFCIVGFVAAYGMLRRQQVTA